MLGAKALLFGAVFVGSVILLWVNGMWRTASPGAGGRCVPWTLRRKRRDETLPELLERTRQRLPWRLLIAGVACLLGLLVAAGEVGNWDMVLRFIYQVPYGQRDTLFAKDIGFYLFSLPAYVALKNWLMLILVLSALRPQRYIGCTGYRPRERRRSLPSPAITHGSALLGCFFVVKAWSYSLDRFLLLYGDNGVVVGASYTDVHVVLPVLWLLVGLALVAAVLSWANMWVGTGRLPLIGAVLVFGTSILLSQVFPALFQRVVVTPNELQLEKPYLQHNITLTRQAYNLQQITVQTLPCGTGLNVPGAAGPHPDHRQHSSVGLAALDRYLPTVTRDSDVLYVP